MAGSDAGPNVLLVVLDSVRARSCSLYGAARSTTPYLASFAEEATTYLQARAPSNWTLPSHVSLFSGLGAHEHRVTVHDRLQPGNTVFEWLSNQGFATGLFTENGFLSSHEVGIKDCFETVVPMPEEYPEEYDTTALNPGPDGFYYADQFLDWSDGVNGPWAACVNVMDAHRPFEPRTEFDRWGDEEAAALQADLDPRWEWAFHGGDRPYWQLKGLEALYAGGIRQVDAVLARLLGTLRNRDVLEETLVVVCGDHGDGFGEPGQIPGEPRAVSHIVPMQESLLHVPLVVRAPEQQTGDRVHKPAALTQFPDVVRGYVKGDSPDQGFVAETVRSVKQPVTADLRERFERHCERVSPFISESRAVYTDGPGKAVRKRYYWGNEGAECLVYRPGIVKRVGKTTRADVDAAFNESTASIRSPLDGRQVTEETKEQLAALGYY